MTSLNSSVKMSPMDRDGPNDTSLDWFSTLARRKIVTPTSSPWVTVVDSNQLIWRWTFSEQFEMPWIPRPEQTKCYNYTVVRMDSWSSPTTHDVY